MPPLIHAINGSHLLCFVYLLIEKGVDGEIVDQAGCSLIHWAAY